MTLDPMTVTGLSADRHHAACSEGHLCVNAPAPILHCPVYVLGEKCRGVVEAFGPGSRKRAAAEAVTPRP